MSAKGGKMNNYTFSDTEEYKVHKFSELLSRLQNMFDSVREENSELYKKLAEFNTDKAVQEWQARYTHAYAHSICNLSDEELTTYSKFRAHHLDTCSNNDAFIITVFDTGIGKSVEITCPVCGRKKYIVDKKVGE